MACHRGRAPHDSQLGHPPRPRRVQRLLDAVMRQARSHRAVNSVTAQPPTFAQPYGGSSISHLLAVARVVVITAAQQRRTMRGSTQLLGRIASGGRWRGDAVMREARGHRVVNSVTAHPCCECPEPLKPGKFFGQRNANSLLSETQRAVALCGTGGVDSRPGHPRVSTSHVRTESRPCGSNGRNTACGCQTFDGGPSPPAHLRRCI